MPQDRIGDHRDRAAASAARPHGRFHRPKNGEEGADRALPPASASGFTLVELLVVIGVVAVLVSILIPTLAAARRASDAARCAGNLRQIGLAVHAFARANNDALHRAPDRVAWVKAWQTVGTSSPVLRLIDRDDADAYWGVAYLPQLASRSLVEAEGPEGAARILAFARRLWLCPAARTADAFDGTIDYDNPVSYGVNGRIVGTALPRTRKLSKYRRPSEAIFAHDAMEARMEDRARDTLTANGGPTNLADWRPGGPAYTYGVHRNPVHEHYRHDKASQVLWLDGHVSRIPMSDGKDVPAWWYEPHYEPK